MEQDRQTERRYAVSRALYSLAREADLTAQQALALGRVASTLDQLSRADPAAIVKTTGIARERVEKLVQAARMLGLVDFSPTLAIKVVDRGLTLDALAESRPEELLQRLHGLPDVTLRQVAAWSVSAAAAIRRARAEPGPPELPDLKAPRPVDPVPVHRLVLDRETTWQAMAKELYGLQGKGAAEWVRTLAAANRSAPEARLSTGTVVVLLERADRKPKLPEPESAIASLKAFAPYLRDDETRRMVEAGIVSPRLLLATTRSPNPDVFGVTGDRIRQLQTQAQLATVKGIAPELAYYMAAIRPRSLRELAQANPLDLFAELAQAKLLGFLDEAGDISVESIQSWLAEILSRLIQDPQWGIPSPTETTVCERAVPDTTHLENYYTYRFAPAGRTAESLQIEVNAKNQWLAEVDDYLAGGADSVRTYTFMERGLRIGRIHMEDLKPWGGTIWEMDRIETLTLLRDFMRDNVRVIQLIQALTEGHESYRHREYGLALAAYGRAENWFLTISPNEFLPFIGPELWWRNEQDGGGVYKPSFLVVYEQNPTDLNAQLMYEPVHDYYTGRQSATDRDTVLETLHVDWPDYHKWRLNPALEGMQTVPFRKFLYYIYNFMLPILKADSYARLGNYCVALDHYFRVYQEDAFTTALDAPREDTIVNTVEGGGPHYPTLLSFTVTTPPQDRYYPQYLNDLEKRLVRLRVAETLLNWGDLHFRGREYSEAKSRYAQVLRVIYDQWDAMRAVDFIEITGYQTEVETRGVNPRACELTFTAHEQLLKIARGFNFLGYPDDYVPIWTYNFLLTSARYFGERARQLGRDALQFLSSAEQEHGNRRLLSQEVAISQGQLAVDSRRVDEAQANIQVAQAGGALADQRSVNNESRKEELEAFGPARQALGIVGGSIGGASAGAGIGGIGGPVGGAIGAGIGAAVGGVTSYISGAIEMQAQRNELERQRLELAKAKAMAQAEVNRALIGASVARLARNVAALNTIFAQSNLEFAQAKTLNAEFWYETSLRLADIASTYLERAIGVSFLSEQAFEFMEGRRLDVIRFDYSQAEGVLSADALLSDLDSIEYERISERWNKVMPVMQIIRLREKDFFAFAELKRTGVIAFESPLFDFDLSHAGSYHQRIARVEVEVRALVPPEGIRGTLRKAGLSYLRYRIGSAGTGTAPPNTATDWIEYTPTHFRIAPVIQADDTLILSPFDIRRDGVILRPDPGEQLRVFEGSGVGTTWTLSLGHCSNEFDFSTITDVNLIVYYYAQFDASLERAVNLERRKLLALGTLVGQRTRGFSLREVFPDEIYHLQNPPFDTGEDSWQQRTLTLEMIAGLFPPNQINRRLQGVILVFVGPDDYMDVHAELATTGFNLPPAAFQAPEADPRIRAALGQNHAPEGTWSLIIRASDNVGQLTLPNLYKVDGDGKVVLDANRKPIPDAGGVPVFDAAKIALIKDIWLIFNYQYDQAGDCGEPIVLWAHFLDTSEVLETKTVPQLQDILQNEGLSTSGTKVELIARLAALARFATGATEPTTTTWFADNLNGIGTWSVSQGRMTQTAAGARSINRPTAGFDWRDVAITGQVRLPVGVDNSGGLVMRYQPPAAGQPSGDYYLGRLTRLADSKLEAALDVRSGGVVTTLKTVEFNALATLTDFELAARARGDQLEVHVNGRPVLRVTDASVNSGSIGLYANGSGIAFAEILVSDLTNR